MKALAQMMKTVARVRRDGEVIEIDAGDLVPGDIVLMEAGNVVPADGRIFVAATLEIEEAALTGESLPVGKTTEPVEGADVPLGDRTCVAYMNTSVTRGRGEMIVTETGMQTEIGHIADLLASTENEKTRRLGVRAIAAVGTAGMRIARNSDDVIRTIHERTGITIEVIPGDEEGRLAYLAVQTGLGEQQGRLVVFDTGGGARSSPSGRFRRCSNGSASTWAPCDTPSGSGSITRSRRTCSWGWAAP